MKWCPKNIRESMYPVLVLNWLLGLGLVDYPVGNSRNKLLIILNLLIASSFWVVVFYSENIPCTRAPKHNLANKLYRMVWYWSICVAPSSIIIGWYHRKRMQLFTQNLERMDEVFECLGLEKNYYKSFKVILCRVLVFIIVIVLIIIQFVYIRIRVGSKENAMQSIVCSCIIYRSIAMCLLVDVTFGIALHCIETRFENINHLLRKGFCEYPMPSFFNKNEIYDIKDFQFRTDLNSTNFEKSKHVIELLKQIHLELCKLAREVNKIFGVQLTLHMTIDFMNMTICLFKIITTYLGPQTKLKYRMIIYILGIFALYLSKLLHINIVCSVTSNQANETGGILLGMKLLRKNHTIIREIDRFYQQINLRPLRFTTCGFSTLGVNFIFRFLGTIVTYLLILIQVDPENGVKAAYS